MAGNGKIVGLLFAGAGIVVEVLALAWLFGNASEGKLQAAAFILGLAVVQVIALPLLGALVARRRARSRRAP